MAANILQSWTTTVAALIEEGAEVYAHCGVCSGTWRCDLGRISSTKGGLYSLWNRTTRCRTLVCEGRVWFKATRPGSHVWVQLREGSPVVVERLHEAWRASRTGEIRGEEVSLNPAVEARLGA